ncbi:GMC family oxidoreductase [Anderseniella sp. Alg231-50]|uniref:GMC family oxidoreductase n=1 Tax=Anderseniella sp. Alg231-50 TaxID=1922226 RepID=UPI00307C4A86
MQDDQLLFDFVIVGAGSAGCVLAGNLSASGKHSVLLLEAGPDRTGFWIKTPLGYGHSIVNKSVNWMYASEPEPGLGGRTVPVPRGRIVGGSSAINAMVYMRGTKADYDEWAHDGNPDWAWDKVLDSYKRMENHCVRDAWHGTTGPLQVNSRASVAHPICNAFLEAGDQLQIPRNDDFNGERVDGLGYYHHTICSSAKRMSASRGWLDPARGRSNFKLLANARAISLEISDHAVTGVVYRRNGRVFTARARREVVLAGGAINTPHLLMVSGIGPGAALRKAGVEVRHELPAVGQHMQDHFAYDMQFRSRVPTLNQQLSTWPGRLRAGLQYYLFGSGPLSSGTTHAGGFVKSAPSRDMANLQLYFSPLTRDLEPGSPGRMAQADPYAAFSMGICNTRPRSRGEVSLSSNDMTDAPLIRFNFLDHPEDMAEMIEGVGALRALADAPALQKIIESEYLPGPDVRSDEDLEQDIRARGYSIYHPCGSCRMGPVKDEAVVNSRLKVHQIQGLRIADASVLPFVVTGNLNGPSMMIGQRASEIILEDSSA